MATCVTQTGAVMSTDSWSKRFGSRLVLLLLAGQRAE